MDTGDVSFSDHFGFDMDLCGPFNLTADLDYEPEILEETEETIVRRDGNGAVLRQHKLHDSTPEHIDFMVKERRAWEEHIKPKLTPDPRRINFENYREQKRRAEESNRFFAWCGVNVFESMHPVCGHEYMLIGMAMDPDWVRDMVNTYARLTVELRRYCLKKKGTLMESGIMKIWGSSSGPSCHRLCTRRSFSRGISLPWILPTAKTCQS